MQPFPEGHLFLLQLHTHSGSEIQQQVLFILFKAWPVGQLLVTGVPVAKVGGQRLFILLTLLASPTLLSLTFTLGSGI